MLGRQERAKNMPRREEMANNMPWRKQSVNKTLDKIDDKLQSLPTERPKEAAAPDLAKQVQDLRQQLKESQLTAQKAQQQFEEMQAIVKKEGAEKRRQIIVNQLKSCQRVSADNNYDIIVKALKEAKTEAQQEAYGLKMELEELKEAYKKMYKKRSPSQAISELEDLRDLLETRVRELKVENVKLHNSHRVWINEKEELQSKLKKTLQDNADLKLLYGVVKPTYCSMFGAEFAEYEEKRNYIEQLKAHAMVRRLIKENDQLQTNLKDKALAFCDFQQQVEKQGPNNKMDKQSSVLQCSMELDDEKMHLQTRVRVPENAQTFVKRLENEKEQLQITLKEQLQTISDINKKLEMEQEEKQALKMQVKKLEDTSIQKLNKISTPKCIRELQADKEHLEASLKHLKQQLKKEQKEKSGYKNQVELLENAYNEQGNVSAQELEEKDQAISALKQQLEETKTESQMLQTSLNDQLQENSGLKQKLEKELEEKDQAISALQQQLEEVKTESQMLQTSLNDQLQENTNLTQQLEKELEEKQGLKIQLAKLEDATVEAQVKNKQIQTSLNNQLQENANLTQQLEKELEEKQGLKIHMANLENNFNKQKQATVVSRVRQYELEKALEAEVASVDALRVTFKSVVDSYMVKYDNIMAETNELVRQSECLKTVHASETEVLQQQIQCLIGSQQDLEEETQSAHLEINELKTELAKKPKPKRKRWRRLFCCF